MSKLERVITSAKQFLRDETTGSIGDVPWVKEFQELHDRSHANQDIQGVKKSVPLFRFGARKAVEYWMNPEARNRENLGTINELFQQGNSIVFMLHHESNGDTPGLDVVLLKEGFKDLAYANVVIKGDKNAQNWVTRKFTQVADYILVDQTVRDLEKKKHRTQEEEARLQEGRKTNADATKAMIHALEQHRNITVFPEGGRTQGVLKEPVDDVGMYTRLKRHGGLYIVAVGVDGTYEVLPKGKKIPRKSNTPSTFTFGEPIDAKELLLRHACRDRERQNHAIMQEMMERIAALTPPESQGPYRKENRAVV